MVEGGGAWVIVGSSDGLIVQMWCHSERREESAFRPYLPTRRLRHRVVVDLVAVRQDRQPLAVRGELQAALE